MGNLRDQLKNANLLSKKDAKRLAHEERIHRKQVGREGLEREARERAEQIDQLQQAERERTRQAQEHLDGARLAAAERAACQDILAHDAVRPRARGGQRFYFEVEDGSLPWLEVDEAMRFQLQSGTYWIVRTGSPSSHCYALLPAEQGKRVARSLTETVAWAPGGAPAIAAAAAGRD